MNPTCDEKATWHKGDQTDLEMMRRTEAARKQRRRYLGALNKAARQIREERRPRLSIKALPESC